MPPSRDHIIPRDNVKSDRGSRVRVVGGLRVAGSGGGGVWGQGGGVLWWGVAQPFS